MFSNMTTLSSSVDEGLQRLIEGNQRFKRGEARFSTVCKETLADLAKGQQPFARILGCSDSRVPPEPIFDANFGELFIVRVAGSDLSRGYGQSSVCGSASTHAPVYRSRSLGLRRSKGGVGTQVNIYLAFKTWSTVSCQE
jgi:carbonic anhydrase